VWEKAQKRPQNGKRWTENGLPRARMDVSEYIWQLSKKLPAMPLYFTGTTRHAPKPTGLPAKRQPKPPFPYKQETAKPMKIVYFPPRPHSSPNGRFSRGETYFLTFCLTLLLHIHHGKLVPVTLKMNTEQTSRDTTKKDRLRIYPEAVLSTLLYRYSLLV